MAVLEMLDLCFGTLGSCMCVSERRGGPDALKPHLVLGDRLCRSEAAITFIRMGSSQLSRLSGSTVREELSVIRQISKHSPPAPSKLNIILVIAKVNILSCHVHCVKI